MFTWQVQFYKKGWTPLHHIQVQEHAFNGYMQITLEISEL